MDRTAYYHFLLDFAQRNERAWQATVVDCAGSTPARPGMKLIVPLGRPETGNLGGGALERLVISQIRSEQPARPLLQKYLLSEQGDAAGREQELPTGMICGGQVTLFIDPLFTQRMLFIVGAGHCGQALAHLAGLCGFQTRLIDDRQEVLAAIPPSICSDLRLGEYSDLTGHIDFSPEARVVIMTHGHTHDQQVLEQCLGRPCAYLGMIGSAGKAAATLQRLAQKGFGQADLDRVHSPVGLPIGSQTPYEIAVSILAQMIQLETAAKP